MMYLCTAAVDWADEFDVHFGELIDEETYQKYSYAKSKLKSYINFYGFGSNEDFEDFDYLDFDFTPITDEEASILTKYNLPGGFGFINSLFSKLTEDLEDNFPEDCHKGYYGTHSFMCLNDDLNDCSIDKFKYYIDKLANL